MIEKEVKTIEAGGTFLNIDNGGDPYLVYGLDWSRCLVSLSTAKIISRFTKCESITPALAAKRNVHCVRRC